MSVDRGVTPHNITLGENVMENLGPGCHNLTLAASNGVRAQVMSTSLELCLMEPVGGLQAVVIAEKDPCPDSTDLTIEVSLERGAPVELLFTLTGARDTLSNTRHMLNGTLQAYTFSSPLEGICSSRHTVFEGKQVPAIQLVNPLKNCFGEGLSKVKVRAMNAFTASDVDVHLEDILQACLNFSGQSLDDYEDTVCRRLALNIMISG